MAYAFCKACSAVRRHSHRASCRGRSPRVRRHVHATTCGSRAARTRLCPAGRVALRTVLHLATSFKHSSSTSPPPSRNSGSSSSTMSGSGRRTSSRRTSLQPKNALGFSPSYRTSPSRSRPLLRRGTLVARPSTLPDVRDFASHHILLHNALWLFMYIFLTISTIFDPCISMFASDRCCRQVHERVRAAMNTHAAFTLVWTKPSLQVRKSIARQG
jgi:hypothetical protein